MSLYKRGNLWWCHIYRSGLPDIQRSTGCKDRDDAAIVEMTFRRAMRGDVNRNKLIASIDDVLGYDDKQVSVMLDDIWQMYAALPDLNVNDKTLRMRQSHLQRLITWINENWSSVDNMAAIDRRCAGAFMADLRQQGLTGKTCNNIRGSLSAIWQGLLIQAGLAENVWKVVPTASVADSRSRRAYTVDEEKRLLKAADNHQPWRDVAIVARYTGLRKGDIINLRWSEIAGDVIKLMPNKTRRHNTRVIIPIHARVAEVLSGRRKDSQWVFGGLRDAGKYEQSEGWQRVMREAKVSDDEYIVDFHSWRHTFRTRLRDAGVSVDMCNKLGGWADDGAGERYDHAVEPLKKAISSLK